MVSLFCFIIDNWKALGNFIIFLIKKEKILKTKYCNKTRNFGFMACVVQQQKESKYCMHRVLYK